MSVRPPRVLVCARPGIGGAARVIEALLRRLPERGVTGTAALSSLEGEDLLDAASDHGWDVVRLDLHRSISPMSDTGAGYRLRKLAPGHDVVHAHAAKAGALARLALPMKRGVPVVYSPHGFYFTYHEEDSPQWKRYLGLEQRLAPRTTLLHCVGDAERAVALEHRLATDENAHVLRNPVPRAVDRNEAALPDDGKPLVVMAARLAAPKDPVTFVRAAAALDPEHSARFVLVGDGALAEDARAAAGDHDVHFLPPETDVRGLLRRARVAVLATDSEALPIFVLEALAEGVPVVATDLAGCRDAAGDAALYVPARDPAALGTAVVRLLADDALHTRLSAAGSSRAALFAEDVWADGLVEMYARVVRPASR